MLSAHTTYSNWIIERSSNPEFRNNRVSFSDFILRYDHEIDEKNNIEVSGYYSRDDFRLKSDTLFSFSDFSYINTNGAIKWSHRFNDRLNGQITGTASHYGYDLQFDETSTNAFQQDFSITDASLEIKMDYYMNDRHEFSFGAISRNYRINPGTKGPLGDESLVTSLAIQKEQALETSFYFSHQFDPLPNFSLSGGFR
ncbi:hypothetical protein FNH22_30675 [Fulvivirga sp. M361]|uniref:hypothetical protein n=1 Tax=Fulvivirga sp. M361 TaxID=2594266 RepID=UPI00117B3E4F|nr:hypothetical protein [Fulvivirga sp. M361]TRX47063.1 hypothetical protein FNH22_30675 [Fulvivirga sp. M361]